MNPILKQLLIVFAEQAGVPFLLSIIQVELANNAAALAQEKGVLLAFADLVYQWYGIVPPVHN